MLLTIWLEIHIKLKTTHKMFCQCKNEQNFETLQPNTNICPVCTGQPGALPTLNKDVLETALKVGKALNCKINTHSQFDRKSYFYPDLPMGYQITQLYKPTNVEGQLQFFLDNYQAERTVHILDAHMENDTAKMIHQGGEALLDFNRAGTPLIEIVTKPDFTTTDEVIEFLKELQRLMRYNNLSDADMEKWQMRCDVNISLRAQEADPLGVRVELKNINSFGAIKRAIDHETARQEALYTAGESFTQQTRGRDDAAGESYLMRSKEDALDYRYFPEPDLPALVLSDEMIARANAQIIESPYQSIKTFKEDYGFHKEYINALIGEYTLLQYFLAHAKNHDPKTVAKRICWPLAARSNQEMKSIEELPFSSEVFDRFLQHAEENKILDNQLKTVMEEMLSTGKDADTIIKEKWFDAPAIDNNELKTIVQTVLDNNPSIVEQYKWGKTTTIGFFVGQVMKAVGGKANPQEIQKIIEEII